MADSIGVPGVGEDGVGWYVIVVEVSKPKCADFYEPHNAS
jgi:hypothetical protein